MRRLKYFLNHKLWINKIFGFYELRQDYPAQAALILLFWFGKPLTILVSIFPCQKLKRNHPLGTTNWWKASCRPF